MRNPLLIAALLVAVASGAAAGGPEHVDTQLHYRFTLPEGWVRIPDVELQQMQQRVQGMLHQVPTFQVGFQLANRQPWFAYPYLVVQHHPVGNASLQQISDELQRTLGTELKKANQQLRDSSLAAEGHANQVRIDSSRQVVVFPLNLTIPGDVRVSGSTFVKPGRIGAVQLNCYAVESEAADFQPQFDQIAASLAFDKGFESDGSAGGLRGWLLGGAAGGLKGGALGALVALIVVAAVFLKKKLAG